ncbi:hypothetical protein JCM3765_004274 [Sporobolomyces pararoseus]
MGARDDWGDEGTRLFGTGYQRYSLLERGEVNDFRKEMIEKRRNGDAAGDQDALHLLSLELADAANWIENNLPLPPNPQALTGGRPLPSPPHLALSTFPKASLTLSEEASTSIPLHCFESISNLSKPQTDFKPLNFSAADDNSLKQVEKSLDNTEIDENKFGSDLDFSGAISSVEPPIQRTSRLPQSSIPRSSSHESLLGLTLLSSPTLARLVLQNLTLNRNLRSQLCFLPVYHSTAANFISSKSSQMFKSRKIVGDSVISYYALKVKTGPSQTTSCLPPKPSNLPFPNERIDPPQRNSLTHLLPSHISDPAASSTTLSSHSILHIAGLPPHFDSVSKVTQLFQDRGIKISGCRLGNYDPLERLPFAFVSTEERYTSKCFKLINGKSIDGLQIELLSFENSFERSSSSPSSSSLITPPPLSKSLSPVISWSSTAP